MNPYKRELWTPRILKVNTDDCTQAVYVGRDVTGAMHYGNPFIHAGVIVSDMRGIHCIFQTRAAAIKAYEEWLRGTNYKHVFQERREWILNNLSPLRGRDLACHCNPLPCHASILIKITQERFGRRLDDITPCVDICKIDGDRCTGCRRTLVEIGQWPDLTAAEAVEKMIEIRARQ